MRFVGSPRLASARFGSLRFWSGPWGAPSAQYPLTSPELAPLFDFFAFWGVPLFSATMQEISCFAGS